MPRPRFARAAPEMRESILDKADLAVTVLERELAPCENQQPEGARVQCFATS